MWSVGQLQDASRASLYFIPRKGRGLPSRPSLPFPSFSSSPPLPLSCAYGSLYEGFPNECVFSEFHVRTSLPFSLEWLFLWIMEVLRCKDRTASFVHAEFQLCCAQYVCARHSFDELRHLFVYLLEGKGLTYSVCGPV